MSNEKTYQNFKDQRSANREKEKVEFRKKEAKQTFEFKKRVAKESNSLWRKKLQWVIDCFNHFLETFPDTPEQIKSEMLDLESCIIKKNEQMENEINAIIEKVQNLLHYSKI